MEGPVSLDHSPQRGQRRWGDLVAWGAFVGLLLVQWSLFQRCLDRELSQPIPRGYDQAVYLDVAYHREFLLVKEVPVAGGRVRLYARPELAWATP